MKWRARPFALMNNDTTEVAFSVIAPTLADQVTAYNNAQIVGQKAQQRIDPITKKPEVLPADKRRADSLAAAQANKPLVKEAALHIFAARQYKLLFCNKCEQRHHKPGIFAFWYRAV